jgi:hypothetical protein
LRQQRASRIRHPPNSPGLGVRPAWLSTRRTWPSVRRTKPRFKVRSEVYGSSSRRSTRHRSRTALWWTNGESAPTGTQRLLLAGYAIEPKRARRFRRRALFRSCLERQDVLARFGSLQ